MNKVNRKRHHHFAYEEIVIIKFIREMMQSITGMKVLKLACKQTGLNDVTSALVVFCYNAYTSINNILTMKLNKSTMSKELWGTVI